MLTPFAALLAASLAALPSSVLAQEQIVFDSVHNATTIVGTWSSGNKAVKTGSGFVNPANQTFKYPTTAGISYSFDDNGHYEIARYRFKSNATDPNCITGIVNWVHGNYQLLGNGSIVFIPFGDGFQQIQDPCAAQSNFLEDYNITELAQSWRIFQDATAGPKLHIFQFDGAPLAPQFLVSPTPIMVPTRMLRNVSSSTTPTTSLTAQNALVNTNRASTITSRSAWSVMAVVASAGVIGVASALL